MLTISTNMQKSITPKNTPEAFQQLADIITKFLTDPSYPQKAEDIVLNDFRDDNIEFYMVGGGDNAIYCYVNNEEYDGKFPLAEIHAFQMDNEDEEYYFYLTEKKDGMCCSWNYSLSPISDDDEVDFDDFDDFDDLDDEY